MDTKRAKNEAFPTRASNSANDTLAAASNHRSPQSHGTLDNPSTHNNRAKDEWLSDTSKAAANRTAAAGSYTAPAVPLLGVKKSRDCAESAAGSGLLREGRRAELLSHRSVI